ncbi:hypothetical protein V499_04646 [Pseudogymnoascus sp. VKM F-103]|nr:hypothetical protein V499_04646 [Pseudogymnoascus sp. VKM F-103]
MTSSPSSTFVSSSPSAHAKKTAPKPLDTSRLSQWRQEGFEAILEEISLGFSCLKELARTLREVLFPLRDGKIWTWTDMSPEGTDNLYDDMMGAFKDGLDCIPVSA